MQSRVRSTEMNLKILGPVVFLVAVDVMDNLTRKQAAPKFLFHDPAVSFYVVAHATASMKKESGLPVSFAIAVIRFTETSLVSPASIL